MIDILSFFINYSKYFSIKKKTLKEIKLLLKKVYILIQKI